MRWLLDLFTPQVRRPQADKEAFERRERELRERLERLTDEVEATTHSPEPERRWQ